MNSIYDQVGEVMSRAGVPMSIWGPIMDIESGGNPSAALTNSREDSIGLFALNRHGGLGSGYTVAELQDPVRNATIASRSMAPNYQAGVSKGLSGLDLLRYVAYNSGFPTMQGVGALSSDPVVKAYDSKLVAQYNSGEGGGGLLATSPGISGLSSLTQKIGIGSMSASQKTMLVGVCAGVLLLVAISD